MDKIKKTVGKAKKSGRKRKSKKTWKKTVIRKIVERGR